MLICIGAVECFYGLKILPATLFIIGYLVGFGLIASIMAEFIVKPGASILLVWASLIIAILFGIISFFKFRFLGIYTLFVTFLTTTFSYTLNRFFYHLTHDKSKSIYFLIGISTDFLDLIFLGGCFCGLV